MTGPARPARVALLGYGLADRVFHGPLVAVEPGLELAAVVTSDPGRAAAAAARHPGAVVVATADELWQRAGELRLDLAVVATPNASHLPLARAALGAGLAVVVDKPLAPTAGEARDLVDLARARGLLLTVFQNRRLDGDLLTVRRLLDEGALGDVVRFESRWSRWRPAPKAGWRSSGAPDAGGGVLLDLGSHLVDQAVHLFGPVAGVHGEVDRRRPASEVDDDVFVALTHENGVRSHLWASDVQADTAPRLRVLGTAGAYVKHGLDVQEQRLAGLVARPGPFAGLPAGWSDEPQGAWGVLTDGERERAVPTEPGAFQHFYAGVAIALRHATPPPVDPEDAVRVLEVLERARACGGTTARSVG